MKVNISRIAPANGSFLDARKPAMGKKNFFREQFDNYVNCSMSNTQDENIHQVLRSSKSPKECLNFRCYSISLQFNTFVYRKTLR